MGETLRIEELDVCFGAHIHDVALGSLSSATFASIREALLEYGLLVFQGQQISRDEQNAFAAMVGPLEFPAAAITNIDDNGEVLSDQGHDTVKSIRGNEGWHHDTT